MERLSQQQLDEIVRRLVDALGPAKVYLFGSLARGAPEPDSDVDLLVVVPDTDQHPRELARRGRRSLWGIGVPVDLIVCTVSEMNRWSGVCCNLFRTVAQEGKVIYAA